MTVLEYCNVDMSTNITDERDSFTKFSLYDYPGQYVGDIFTASLKLIKIMQQGYLPPVYIG